MKSDSSRPSGSRVTEVEMNKEPIHSMKLYTVATRTIFIRKNGLKYFVNTEMVDDGEKSFPCHLSSNFSAFNNKNMKLFCPLKNKVGKVDFYL